MDDSTYCKCRHILSKHDDNPSVVGCTANGSTFDHYCPCLKFEIDKLKLIQDAYEKITNG